MEKNETGPNKFHYKPMEFEGVILQATVEEVDG